MLSTPCHALTGHYHISLGCFNHPNPDPHLQSTCTQKSELSSQKGSGHTTPQLSTLQWLLSALKLSCDFCSISEEEQDVWSPCSLTPLTSYLQDYESHILFLLMNFFSFSNSSCFSFTLFYLCLCFLPFFYLPHPWWLTPIVLQVRRKSSQAPQLSIKTPRGVLFMPPDAVTLAQFDLDWWVDGKLWQQRPQLAWPQCLTFTGTQEYWRTSWNFKSTCSSV